MKNFVNHLKTPYSKQVSGELFPAKQAYLFVLFTICIILSSNHLHAQQLGLTSLYRYNWQILNPAAVNHSYLEDKNKQYMANASYRQQWAGFEGAPLNYSMRFEYLPEDLNIKAGGFAYGEQAGAIGTNAGYLNFAYLIYFNKCLTSEEYLAIGTNIGMVNYRVDLNEIVFQDPQPGLFGEEGFEQWYADMSFGAFYRWKTYDPSVLSSIAFKEFYAGISIPQTFTLNFNTPDTLNYSLERIRHYYLMSGAFISLNNKILLEPSIWVRYAEDLQYQTLFNNNPISADANIRVQYDNLIWIGTGFSTNRLAHFEAGTSLGRGQYLNSNSSYALTLALAYDVPIGWNSWLGPSFEVSIGVAWD
jgi:type IX secretion system PorP/SprF family membrane protein